MAGEEITILTKILNNAVENQSTDIHLAVGSYPFVRVKGRLITLTDDGLLTPEMITGLVDFLVPIDKKPLLEKQKDLTYIYTWQGKIRFRVNIFKQKGYFGIALKLVNQQIKTIKELNLPEAVEQLAKTHQGLIFITGPFNSGRTATLNAIIETINQTRAERILYLEEPIEHLFFNNKSIIEQREVGVDVESFTKCLDMIKEEDINVVAVAKVDNVDTLERLFELAESGRLVLAVLNYSSVVTALSGLVSDFSDAKVPWARNVLSNLLAGIIVQQLIPATDGGLALALEILTSTPSVKTLIAEGSFGKLTSIIQTSKAEGMMSLDKSLMDLVGRGKISIASAVENASDPKAMELNLRKTAW